MTEAAARLAAGVAMIAIIIALAILGAFIVADNRLAPTPTTTDPYARCQDLPTVDRADCVLNTATTRP